MQIMTQNSQRMKSWKCWFKHHFYKLYLDLYSISPRLYQSRLPRFPLALIILEGVQYPPSLHPIQVPPRPNAQRKRSVVFLGRVTFHKRRAWSRDTDYSSQEASAGGGWASVRGAWKWVQLQESGSKEEAGGRRGQLHTHTNWQWCIPGKTKALLQDNSKHVKRQCQAWGDGRPA